MLGKLDAVLFDRNCLILRSEHIHGRGEGTKAGRSGGTASN